MNTRRKTRGWLIGSAAFIAILSISGCSRMRSMLGMNDYEPAPATRTAQFSDEAPLAITTNETGTESHALAVEQREDSPAVANGPLTVQPQVASPVELADAETEPGVPAPPRAMNSFGEFEGMPRAVSGAAQQQTFQQHTFASEGFDSDVSVDASGRWMVFCSTRHSTHPQIYLQRTDGTAVTQLTGDAADYANPVFSADSKQIAFASTRAGNWDIYVMDLDGRNIVQVTNSESQDLHPSFSPDGTRLVYSSLGSRTNRWELWTADLSRDEKRMIGYGLFPTWSPSRDKDQIAFQRARQRGSRWFSLWTLDMVNGEARSVTEIAASTNSAIIAPSWSPDGRRLAFVTIVEPSSASAEHIARQDIWTVNADGTNRQRLTDGAGADAAPCWASDNRVFFVSNRGGADCVWSTRADASQPAIAKDRAPTEKHPVQSADADH